MRISSPLPNHWENTAGRKWQAHVPRDIDAKVLSPERSAIMRLPENGILWDLVLYATPIAKLSTFVESEMAIAMSSVSM